MPSRPDADSRSTDSAAMASRLRLSAARLARQLRQQSSVGLTPSQLSALTSISRRGPLTLGDLAEHERVSPPTITKIVRKLIAAGLVAKAADPDDRRFSVAATTVEGEALLAASREKRDAWLAVRLEALEEDQRRRLADALDVLEALVEDEP